MKNEKVTQRQLLAVTLVFQLSPIIRLLPTAAVEAAGRSAWVSIITALLPSVLYIIFICRFVRRRGENEGLGDLIIRCTGSVFGRILCAVFLMWVLFYSGFILRTSSERLLSTIFANGKLPAISFIMLLAVLSTAYGSIKTVAGMGEILSVLIGGALTVTLVASLKDVKMDYLLPVTPDSVPGIFKASVIVFDISTAIAYVAFLSGYAKKRDDEVKMGVRWGVYGIIAMFAITVCTVGTLSAPLLAKTQNPFFIMIKNISALGVIERIESVVVGMWVFTDFLYLTVLMNIAVVLFEDIFGKKKNAKPAVCALWGAVAFAVSFFVGKTAFDMGTLSKVIVPMANLVLMSLVLPIINIIGKLRGTV